MAARCAVAPMISLKSADPRALSGIERAVRTTGSLLNAVYQSTGVG